jgi:hypothetical protein
MDADVVAIYGLTLHGQVSIFDCELPAQQQSNRGISSELRDGDITNRYAAPETAQSRRDKDREPQAPSLPEKVNWQS